MLKKLKNKASEIFACRDLNYIEDFFDTRVKEIPITKTTDEEWKEEFEPFFENCNLNHNNNSTDIKNFIEVKVKNKNDYKNQLESRKRYKEERVVEYKKVIEDLDNGVDRSRKNKVREKAEQLKFSKELDATFPVPFFLKDEYRDFIIGLVVLAEAILFYSTSSMIFNNNPEVNLMITLSLAGASILLIMLLANELGSKALCDDKKVLTWQEKATIAGIVIVLSCYVWFRIATRHVIEFASDSAVVEWAGTVMIALTPLFISLVAFKIEYHAITNKNLNGRRNFIKNETDEKCKRLKKAYPTADVFENMEEEHFSTIKENVEKAITDEVEFGMICFNSLLVQKIKANPEQFTDIMKKLEKSNDCKEVI